METVSKSEILSRIARTIDANEPLTGEWIERRTGRVITVTVAVKPQDVFVDKAGVKWTRM
jgi:hypothetical protein